MKKVLHVIDTNVLIDDPRCLWHMSGGDVFLPYTVMGELRGHTRDEGERGYGAREALRNIDALMRTVEPALIGCGIPIVPIGDVTLLCESLGTLFFGMVKPPKNKKNPDVAIVDEILRLGDEIWVKDGYEKIVLVTNDLPFRIEAQQGYGIHAQPYDVSAVPRTQLHGGHIRIEDCFWRTHTRKNVRMQSQACVRITGPDIGTWYPGLCMVDLAESFMGRVLEVNSGSALIVPLIDYTKIPIWATYALNVEQSYALNALLDPEIDLVTIEGQAGTGKTLISLLAALYLQSKGRYEDVVVTRATVPLGEEIGFLPGDEEEKMKPWMGGISDNVRVINRRRNGLQSQNPRLWSGDMPIQYRSINFIRGRSFTRTLVIVDEAQNSDIHIMQAIVTRAGAGTKVVCIGNTAQIDTKGLHATTNGFTVLIQHSKSWKHAVHITLKTVERSRLAAWANSLPTRK